MSVPTDIAELMNAARCYRCVPNGAIASVQIYEATSWANAGAAPGSEWFFGEPEPELIFGDPGADWGFGGTD